MTEPTTPEPTTPEPTPPEPTTSGPTTPEPTTAEPTTAEPTTAEPTMTEPTPPGPNPSKKLKIKKCLHLSPLDKFQRKLNIKWPKHQLHPEFLLLAIYFRNNFIYFHQDGVNCYTCNAVTPGSPAGNIYKECYEGPFDDVPFLYCSLGYCSTTIYNSSTGAWIISIIDVYYRLHS